MTETQQKKFFYGWIIVPISTLALLVSNGLTIGGIPVFSEWVRNDFIAGGVILKENAQTIVANFGVFTFLTAGLTAPLAGYCINKFPLKPLMLLGCVIIGAGLLLHSQARSLAAVYTARVMFGVGLGFIGVLINTVLVSNWFRKLRGTALGIVLCGTSFGGVIIPLLATPLIKNYGWRVAMMLVSLLIWLVLMPAIILLVKEKPADLGLFPDGDATAPEQITVAGQAAAPDGLTLFEAMRTPIFWVFAFCAMLIFYPLFVTTQQLILYLRTERIGMTPAAAASMISLMSGLSIGGKFLFGFLSDRFSPTRVMFMCCLTMFIGTLFFLKFSAGVVLFFIVPFGLGYGGTFVLLQRLIADYFGAREYPKILGVVTVIETIGAAIGGRITGAVADANGGDYAQAFLLLIAATGTALLLTLALNALVKTNRLQTA
jgi:MFS family permease